MIHIKRIVSIGVVVISITISIFGDSSAARQLNADGYKLYQQGRYNDAMVLFKKACDADPRFDLAYYNYACTLGVLMKNDYPEWYTYKSEALQYLKKAVTLNRKTIEKMKKDTDLDVLRKEFEFYTILGLTPLRTHDTRVLLTSLTWYVQGPGIMAVIGGIHFLPDGTFKLWYHDTAFLHNPETNHDYIYTGIYSIERNTVTLKLTTPMLQKRTIGDIYDNSDTEDPQTEFIGTLHSDGTLEIQGFEYKFYSWYDEFSA